MKVKVSKEALLSSENHKDDRKKTEKRSYD